MEPDIFDDSPAINDFFPNEDFLNEGFPNEISSNSIPPDEIPPDEFFDEYIYYETGDINPEDIYATYDDYDEQKNVGTDLKTFFNEDEIKISAVLDIYDRETTNFGIYKAETEGKTEYFTVEDNEKIHIRGDEIELSPKAFSEVINYDTENEREHLSVKDIKVNVVGDEKLSKPFVYGNNKVDVSISLMEKSDIKNADTQVATRYSDDNIVLRTNIDNIKDRGIVANKIVEKGKEVINKETFIELRTKMLDKKIDLFENHSELKDFLKMAANSGFLTKGDQNTADTNVKVGEGKEREILKDVVKAETVICRIFSMSKVLNIAKDSYAKEIIEGNVKAREDFATVQSRVGNIERAIQKVNFLLPFSEIGDLVSNLGKISNFIKDALPDSPNIEPSGLVLKDGDKTYVITEEKQAGKNIDNIAKMIESKISPVIIKDGRFVKVDTSTLTDPIGISKSEKIEKTSITEDDVKALARGDKSVIDIEKVKNEETIKVYQESQENKTKEETKEETKDRIKDETKDDTKDETIDDRQDKKEGGKKMDDFNNDFNNNNFNKVDDDDNHKKEPLTPGKIALSIGAVGVVSLFMFAGPAAIIGMPILAGAAIARQIYAQKKETSKEEDKTFKAQTKQTIEKEEGPSFKDRVANKVYEFGEKIKNSRVDNSSVFNDRIDNVSMKNGISKTSMAFAISDDMDNNKHPHFEKISDGLHKINNTLGNVFDKIMKPGIDSSNLERYYKTADVRANDAVKNEIGLKGETFGSAFRKIAVMAGHIGQPFVTIGRDLGSYKDVANAGVKTEAIKNGEDQKFTLGDFIKSAFGLLGKISLGTIIASHRIDYSDKIFKIDTPDVKAENAVDAAIKDKFFSDEKVSPDEREKFEILHKEVITPEFSPKERDTIVRTYKDEGIDKALEKIQEIRSENNIENKEFKDLDKEEIKDDTKDDIEDNEKDNIENDEKDDIEDNEKDDIEDDVKDDIEDNVKDDTKDDIEDNVKDDTKDDIEDNEKDNIEDDQKDNIEDEAKDDIEDDVKDNIEDDEKDDEKDNIEDDTKDNIENEEKDNIEDTDNIKDDVKDIDDVKNDFIEKLKSDISEKDLGNSAEEKLEAVEDIKKIGDVLKAVKNEDFSKEEISDIRKEYEDNGTDNALNKINNIENENLNDKVEKTTNNVEEKDVLGEDKETKKANDTAVGMGEVDASKEVDNESADKKTDSQTDSQIESPIKESDTQNNDIDNEQILNNDEVPTSEKVEDATQTEVRENDSPTDSLDSPQADSPDSPDSLNNGTEVEAEATSPEIESEELQVIDLNNPEEVKEAISGVLENNNKINELADILAAGIEKSENDEGIFNFSDALRDAGEPESNILDVVNRALDTLDYSEEEKNDILEKIEPPSVIETIADKIVDDITTLFDAAGQLLDAFAQPVENSVDNAGANVDTTELNKFEAKAEEEIANDLENLQNIAENSLENNQDVVVNENMPQEDVVTDFGKEAETVTDYSNKEPDDFSQELLVTKDDNNVKDIDNKEQTNVESNNDW